MENEEVPKKEEEEEEVETSTENKDEGESSQIGASSSSAFQPYVRKCPKDIKYNDAISCIALHPTRDCIVAGDMDGKIFFHSYSFEESNAELFSLTLHKRAVRGVEFTEDGLQLVTASKDKSLRIVDMNQGKTKMRIKNAHDAPIYSLVVINEHQVATGDDDGTVKLWDDRQPEPIMNLKEMEDYVSCLTVDVDKKILLATSGDGTLTSFNIRSRKKDVQSELANSELLSVSIVKEGRKVVVGNSSGELEFFNWKEFGLANSKFAGSHPDAIDVILPITDDLICTGCRDGKIRALTILPNSLLGIVGSHGEFPINSLDLSRCGKFVASCSDEVVKFWNIKNIKNRKGNPNARNTERARKFALPGSGARNDFFDGLR